MSDGALPSAPTGLRSDVNGNSVTVSWSPVPSVDPTAVATYVLQAGTTPGAANLFNASVGPATSMSGVLGAGSYYWRVVTLTSAGASAPSAEQQFVIGGCVSPSAPTDFRFSVSGRSVTLAWNAPLSGSPVNYLVEAGSQPTLANLLVAAVGAETTVGTSAPPGTYYVRIRAQNACGTSVPSNEQIILVP